MAAPLRTTLTSPHFEVLDGLRGIAALCVFFYHSGNHTYAANGFLAVDFFFMLSGFVVAYSYHDRLRDGRMSLGNFIKRRIARLYPMMFLGVLLGALVLVAHNVASPNQAYSVSEMSAWAGSGLLLIPYLEENPFLNAVFPVNVVLWSLFLEVAANIIYAVGVRRVSVRVLLALIVGGLVTVIWTGHIDGGGSVETFGTGFARVTAGFAAGILLCKLQRSGLLPQVGSGPMLIALPLIVLTLLPRITNPLWLPPIYAAFGVMIIAAIHSANIGRFMLWLCQMLGLISYPLYLLHRPITNLTVGFGKLLVPLSNNTYPWFIAAAFVISILASIIVARVYEPPARNILARLLASKPMKAA